MIKIINCKDSTHFHGTKCQEVVEIKIYGSGKIYITLSLAQIKINFGDIPAESMYPGKGNVGISEPGGNSKHQLNWLSRVFS